MLDGESCHTEGLVAAGTGQAYGDVCTQMDISYSIILSTLVPAALITIDLASTKAQACASAHILQAQ